MTLKEAIARQGYDPAQVLAEIGATNAELDALGIVLDTDPRKATKTGAAKQQHRGQAGCRRSRLISPRNRNGVHRPAAADARRRPVAAGDRRCRGAHRRGRLVDRRDGAPARSWTGKRYDEVLSLDPAARRSLAPERRRAAAQHPRRLRSRRRHRRRRAGVDREEQRRLRGPRHRPLQRPGRRRAAVAGRPRRHHPQRLGRLCRPRLRGDRAGRPGAGLARDRLAAAGALGRADRRRCRRRLSSAARSHALPPHLARSGHASINRAQRRPATGEQRHGSRDAGGRDRCRRGRRHAPPSATRTS